MQLEDTEIILKNLQKNEDFTRKVLPYLKEEYFSTKSEQCYFNAISDFYAQYSKNPTPNILSVAFKNMKIDQSVYDELEELLQKISDNQESEEGKWLLDMSEKFCKNRSLHLALMESISIAGGENKNLSETAIPDLLQKAISISFDTNVGHDYINDADKRYEYYHSAVPRIPFFLDSFNKATNGGTLKKTLNAVVAETGGGKSIFLCNLAANYIKEGHNVLYISMEMAEEELSKRIDANLLDVSVNAVDKITKDKWSEKIADLKLKVKNSLIIKEYPTSGAHTGHFRFLLQELKQKRGFIPSIVIVDYINICASAKLKVRQNMYEYVKSISEELRALAVEFDIVLWTATQFNTEGTGNSDPEMTNVAESRGLNHTLDFLFALVHSEELAQSGQVMIKQLKSRLADKDKMLRWIVGLDKDKMRFYDIQNTFTPATNKTQPTLNKPNPSRPVSGIKKS